MLPINDRDQVSVWVGATDGNRQYLWRAAIDYGPVADLYDACVPLTQDIPFFVEETRAAEGPVLELMSGTGRVSLPLLESGVPLTCADYSAGMLDRLRAKLRDRSLRAHLVLADVRRLPFAGCFPLAILPFNSFSEIVGTAEQTTALESIRAALVMGGSFVCVLHNPSVRLQTIDGSMRTLRRIPHPSGTGEVVLRLRLTFDEVERVASGVQVFEERADDGRLLRERRMEMRFALPTREEFEARARQAGFRVDALFGDFDRSPYVEAASPHMIWRLGRR